MAKVICTLPNASSLINGVKFVEHKLGMISEEIEDDVAAFFASIKGYKIAAPPKETAPAGPVKAAAQPPADAPATSGATATTTAAQPPAGAPATPPAT